jgi:subtilisin family serine protease
MSESAALTLSNRWIRTGLALVTALAVQAQTAQADQRFLLRTPNLLGSGASVAESVCALAGCSVQYPLDGEFQQVFLVTTVDEVDPEAFVSLLSGLPGVSNAEADHLLETASDDAGSQVPAALQDRELVDFFGATVWHGYLGQPAAQTMRILEAHSLSGLTGRGVRVAVIDTGVDHRHPALRPFLLPGYDFTRDLYGGSERRDLGVDSWDSEPAESEGSESSDDSSDGSVDQSTMAVVEDDTPPVVLNQSTMAVVEQSTMAVVESPALRAFGHGTMVAGVVHLVAPEAAIMPLKAFRSDGSGYSSDIVRAIYYAVGGGAKVLNMSFSFAESSEEVRRAVNYAMYKGVLVVASAGNNGEHAASYPAAIPGVIGVASTDNYDAISAFSNYGEDLFWVAAPGEAIITPYPFGTYAAAWGTSFSAPFTAGAAALLAQQKSSIAQDGARRAIGDATPIAGVRRGRIDIVRAVTPQTSTSIVLQP